MVMWNDTSEAKLPSQNSSEKVTAFSFVDGLERGDGESIAAQRCQIASKPDDGEINGRTPSEAKEVNWVQVIGLTAAV
jgi:hypothetical protein